MRNKLKEWEDNYFTIFDIFAHHNIKFSIHFSFANKVLVELEDNPLGILRIHFYGDDDYEEQTFRQIVYDYTHSEILGYYCSIVDLALKTAHLISGVTPCKFCVRTDI